MNQGDRRGWIFAALERASTPITAEALGATLEVSVRTIYRDIEAMRADGLPIATQTGAGIWLERRAPLSVELTVEQAMALAVHLADAAGAGAATLHAARHHILCALPDAMRRHTEVVYRAQRRLPCSA